MIVEGVKKQRHLQARWPQIVFSVNVAVGADAVQGAGLPAVPTAFNVAGKIEIINRRKILMS